MRSCSTELEGRSGTVSLTEWSGASEPAWEVLLAPTHATRPAWRVVDLFSEDARLPWRAELVWGAGGAQGQLAWVSVARATHVCVFASSLRVRAQNWSLRKHTVSAAVADGFDPTRNQLEYQEAVDAGFPVKLSIPPFADRLHVEVANRTLAGTTEVRQFITWAFEDVGINLEWKGTGVDEKGYDQLSGKVVVECLELFGCFFHSQQLFSINKTIIKLNLWCFT